MVSVTRQPDKTDFFEMSVGMPMSTPDRDEITDAAWKLTPTAGIIDYIKTPSYPTDPTFKPDMNTLDRRYWPSWDELENSGSLDEFRNIQLRQVENDDAWETISEGGISAYAKAIGYDIFDPATMPFWFIPFVGQGGRLANMARAGAAITTEMAARESIAHFQQPSRTYKQTVPIMVGATTLGLAMGAALRPSMRNVPTEEIDNMIKQQDKAYKSVVAEELAESPKGKSLSASATEVYGKTARLDEERMISPKFARKLVIPTPDSRLANSVETSGMASPSAISDELTRSFFAKGRDEMGIAPVYPNGKLIPYEEEVEGYKRFASAWAGNMNKEARIIIKDKIGVRVSYANTTELLARMARYGDGFWIPAKLSKKIPGIDKVIKDLEPLVDEYRKMKYEKWGKRKERVGMYGYKQKPVLNKDGTPKLKKNGEPVTKNMLDENGKPIKLTEADIIKYSEHHMHTSYSRKAIRDNPSGFAAAVVKGYTNPERQALTGLAPDTRTVDQLYERGLDASSNVASSIRLNAGDGGGLAKHYGPPGSKPITLKVLRKDIDDYIIHSIDDELNYLAKEVEPILNGLERYGDDGLLWNEKGMDIPALFKTMEEEFLTKRTVLASGDSIAYEKLLKGYEQHVKDVQYKINKITGADRNLGIFSRKFGAFLNELRAASSFAWLGGVAASSVHEVARTQMFHGLGPLAKSMGMVISPTDLAKATRKQLESYHMALDAQSARSTAMLRAEVEDPVAVSGWGSAMSRNVNTIYKVTFMDKMITGMKNVEAFAFMTDAVDFAIKAQKPKVGSGAYKAAMRNFTRFGITADDFKGLAKQVKNKGIVQEKGVWLIDDAKFTDGELLDKFMRITAGAGETFVVTGGAGSIPIILDNPIGRSIVQFKRVFFGYQSRMENLALSLSEGDMRAASGLMTSFAMTWASWQLRMFLKYMDDPSTAAENFAKDWNKTPIQDHIWQMLTRTGYTGLAHIGLEQADKLTKGGLSAAIHTNVGSKHFKGDGTVVANMIPSLTYAEKLMSVMTASLKEGGATPKDLKTAKSLIMLNSVVGADQILDAIATSVGTTIENPNKKVKEKADKEGVYYR
jgi:hypothetical protein